MEGLTYEKTNHCNYTENRKYQSGRTEAVSYTHLPVGQAMQDGLEKQVIVLTQNEGYVKKPNKLMPLIRLRYRRYPCLLYTSRCV